MVVEVDLPRELEAMEEDEEADPTRWEEAIAEEAMEEEAMEAEVMAEGLKVLLPLIPITFNHIASLLSVPPLLRTRRT